MKIYVLIIINVHSSNFTFKWWWNICGQKKCKWKIVLPNCFIIKIMAFCDKLDHLTTIKFLSNELALKTSGHNFCWTRQFDVISISVDIQSSVKIFFIWSITANRSISISLYSNIDTYENTTNTISFKSTFLGHVVHVWLANIDSYNIGNSFHLNIVHVKLTQGPYSRHSPSISNSSSFSMQTVPLNFCPL